MRDVFSNLLISSPNNGGLFLLHCGATYKLDGLDTTGFAVHGNRMLRALQPARLVRFGTVEPDGVTSEAEFDDIHDVLLDGKFCYVVKTDTNEIVKLDDHGREHQRWALPGERDSWHVNCLARWNSKLVFSAFGDFRSHKQYKASSRESGFVQDLGTGEKLITGLSQPHSLLAVGGNLLLADSENFEIREYDVQGHLLRSKKLDGYTRGLFLHKDVLFVGLSRSRNVDLGPLTSGVVVALNAESWEEMDRRQLSVDEIFSIQRIEDTAMAETLARLASHATRLLKEQIDVGGLEVVRLKSLLGAVELQAEDLRREVGVAVNLIHEKDLRIQDLGGTIQDNERKIYGLLETVHGKDLHIQSREEIIRARDLEIQRRDEVIHNKEREIQGRYEVIRSKDEEIRRSGSRIASLTEEIRLQAEIFERLRGEADVQAQKVSDMGREADAAYSKLQTLMHKLQLSQARVADMESSRSWKITRPMRAVKMALAARRARQLGKDDRENGRKSLGASDHRRNRNSASMHSVDVTSAQETPEPFDGKNLDLLRDPIKPQFDLRGSLSPIAILTTPHCTYVAEEIAAALRQIGIKSQIIYKMPEAGYDDVPHFVICPQMFERLPSFYVSFQMEQSVSSRWFTKDYLNQLENSFAIFDYSLANIAKLENMGLHTRQMYHMPIGYLENYGVVPETGPAEYDVIFYGDIQNARRREFIAELSNVCKVKVINDLFGPPLHAELARARLVVNIHYYAGALLETTRLWECLSLDKLVISERSADMDQHGDLVDLVDFVDVDDVAGMVERVTYWLSNEELRQQRLQRNKKALRAMPNQFDTHFYRFLLATDNITFDEFWNLAGRRMELGGNKVCLNLPEYVRRSRSFDRDNRFGFVRFIGLRHSQGWVGCAMSYKLMIMLARQQGLPSVTICEDDVEFPQGFESRWAAIQKQLIDAPNEWDVFSGLLADLHSDAQILSAYKRDDIQFAVTDRLISTVFNVYGATVFDAIASWDERNRDAATNTIDRYLERTRSLRVLTTLPFLAGHKEELHSTLWGFQNTQYVDLIAASNELLANKVGERLRAEGGQAAAQ